MCGLNDLGYMDGFACVINCNHCILMGLAGLLLLLLPCIAPVGLALHGYLSYRSRLIQSIAFDICHVILVYVVRY